jgi:hypothetical protein
VGEQGLHQKEDEDEMDRKGILAADGTAAKKAGGLGGSQLQPRNSIQKRKEQKLRMASLAPGKEPAARSAGTTSSQDIAEMLGLMRSMSREMKEVSDQVWTVSDDMKRMKKEMTKVQQTLNEP